MAETKVPRNGRAYCYAWSTWRMRLGDNCRHQAPPGAKDKMQDVVGRSPVIST
jgi:hypothetical protein